LNTKIQVYKTITESSGERWPARGKKFRQITAVKIKCY
jgi:hypothetical protein